MVKNNNEEFSLETCKDHHASVFCWHSCSVSCKSLSTRVDHVLEQLPDLSWGILGDKFPAFIGFITFALIMPLIVFGLTLAVVLTLCELAFLFPLNYIAAFLIFIPIPLLLRSLELKAFRRELETYLHSTTYNPSAVDEYKQLLNS